MNVDRAHKWHEYDIHFLPSQVQFFSSLNAVYFGFPDDVSSEIG